MILNEKCICLTKWKGKLERLMVDILSNSKKCWYHVVSMSNDTDFSHMMEHHVPKIFIHNKLSLESVENIFYNIKQSNKNSIVILGNLSKIELEFVIHYEIDNIFILILQEQYDLSCLDSYKNINYIFYDGDNIDYEDHYYLLNKYFIDDFTAFEGFDTIIKMFDFIVLDKTKQLEIEKEYILVYNLQS
jgi:hypothetical protein